MPWKKPKKLMAFYLKKLNYAFFEIISDLNFLAFLESLKDFAELRNLSIPPLKSTVLNAELETFNFTFFFRASLLKLTFLILGKNLLLVLLFAWLTLLPFIGFLPVSSHFLDINIK